jgi:hypothetical protein
LNSPAYLVEAARTASIFLPTSSETILAQNRRDSELGSNTALHAPAREFISP